MESLPYASDSVGVILRKTLRLSFALEGVSWTLAALRVPARVPFEEAGYEFTGALDRTPPLRLAALAERLRETMQQTTALAYAAGLKITGAERDEVEGLRDTQDAKRSGSDAGLDQHDRGPCSRSSSPRSSVTAPDALVPDSPCGSG